MLYFMRFPRRQLGWEPITFTLSYRLGYRQTSTKTWLGANRIQSSSSTATGRGGRGTREGGNGGGGAAGGSSTSAPVAAP